MYFGLLGCKFARWVAFLAVLSYIRLDYSLVDGVQSEHLRRTKNMAQDVLFMNKSSAAG